VDYGILDNDWACEVDRIPRLWTGTKKIPYSAQPSPYLRKTFKVKQDIKKIPLYVTFFGFLEMY